jgi:hypothetical protein
MVVLWTRIITVTATDKCGNTQQQAGGLHLERGHRAARGEQCARGGDLGCNPAEIPDCDD